MAKKTRKAPAKEDVGHPSDEPNVTAPVAGKPDEDARDDTPGEAAPAEDTPRVHVIRTGGHVVSTKEHADG